MRQKFLEECTPGYYNNEGKPSALAARNGFYGGGSVAFIEETAGLARRRPPARSRTVGLTSDAKADRLARYSVDLDNELSRSPQRGVESVGRGVPHESRRNQSAGELAKRDLALEPRQRGAEAAVDAAAEAEVLIVRPVGVKHVRPVEAARVAVGRGEHQIDQGALGNRLAGDVDVAERRARGEVNRRLVAQEFFDEPGRDPGLPLQPLQ